MANKNKYSVAQKIAWCQQSWAGESFRRIRDHFAAANPDVDIPSLLTISRTVKRFNETGCLNSDHVKHPRPNRSISDDERLRICLSFEENNRTSTRNVSQELGFAQSTVLKVLHQLKYFPYKLHREQELLPGDDEARMNFCEYMSQRIDLDQILPRDICFTDESTMVLHGVPNRQNVRIWSVVNPYEAVATKSQYPQKLNVWCGMYRGRIIGPIFIEGNLNGEKYLNMLRTRVVPELRRLQENGRPIIFQHDGAPPHSTLAVRAYLDEVFPGNWIGRYGPIPWPARSPDLSPLDYSFWGHVKSLLYATHIDNLDGLTARIIQITEDFDEAQVLRATDHFYDRLGFCAAREGGTFEKFL